MEEYYDGVVAKPDLDELYHHGILGMHWGKRNGPPYPLDSDKSTGHRLKTGAAGSISKKRAKKKALKDRYDYKSKKTVSEREKVLDNLYTKDPKTGKRGDGSTIDPNSKEYQKIINKAAKEYLDKYANEVVDYGEDGKMTRKEWNKFSEDTVNNIDKRNPGFKEWLDNTYPDRSEHPVTEYDKYEREYEEIKNDTAKLDAEMKDTAKTEEKIAQKKDTINRRLQNAKSLDQWDLNFLEAVQNAPFTEQHITGEMSDSAYKTKMLQEYKKYLEDPEKYWKNR